MCLQLVCRSKNKRDALAKFPDEFYVWKVVRKLERGFFTPCQRKQVFAGEQAASRTWIYYIFRSRKRYLSGWHAFASSQAAIDWANESEEVIRCQAQKKHIRAIGMDGKDLVIVFSHLTFPKKCGAEPKRTK